MVCYFLIGDVVTVEMVSIHLDSSVWEGPEVEVDRCHWTMADKQHLYMFARIFYLFQCPSYEQMGECQNSDAYISQISLI